jgi:hypothetical protein
MAAPLIVCESVYQPCAQRIEMNVSNKFFQVGIGLNRDSPVPPFKEMPGPVHFLIRSSCILTGDEANKPGKWGVMALNGHVHVIRHPAIGMNSMLVSFQT